MALPKNLIVEFDDGSRRQMPFGKLDREIQESLLKVWLCPEPASEDSPLSYLLFRWRDGWQEVLGIKKEDLDLFRYYVIERVEEIGRMSFDADEEYPVLFYVKRLPRDLESILLVDRTGARSCTLTEQASVRLGETREHIFYDRERFGCAFGEEGAANSWIGLLAKSIKRTLGKKGMGVEQVLSMTPNEKALLFRHVSADMGIQAMERQEDVGGFIELLLFKCRGGAETASDDAD